MRIPSIVTAPVAAALAGLAGLFGMTAPAGAQQALKPEELGKIKTDVYEAMSKYVDAYNRGDSKFIGNSAFANPSAIWIR